MKKFNIRKVLDGLKEVSSSTPSVQVGPQENHLIQETIQSEHFQLCKVREPDDFSTHLLSSRFAPLVALFPLHLLYLSQLMLRLSHSRIQQVRVPTQYSDQRICSVVFTQNVISTCWLRVFSPDNEK